MSWGFTSFSADFMAGAVIGLILGTTFKFLAYRYFVFSQSPDALAFLEPVAAEKDEELATARI